MDTVESKREGKVFIMTAGVKYNSECGKGVEWIRVLEARRLSQS